MSVKCYLLIHNEGISARDGFVDVLNAMPEVLAWRYDMTSCFYILATASAQQIADGFRLRVPSIDRLLVTEVTANTWGWLTQDSWTMLLTKRFPESKPQNAPPPALGKL